MGNNEDSQLGFLQSHISIVTRYLKILSEELDDEPDWDRFMEMHEEAEGFCEPFLTALAEYIELKNMG